jgi:hypothetical protein
MDDLPRQQRVHLLFFNRLPVIRFHGGYCSL